MRLLAILAAVALTGCAATGVTTVVYEHGRPVLKTGADMQTVDFSTAAGTRFSATGVVHSTPMLANGAGTALIIDATGRVIGVISAGVVSGLVAVPNPTAGAITAGVPAVVRSAQAPVQTVDMRINHQFKASASSKPRKHKRRHRPNAVQRRIE